MNRLHIVLDLRSRNDIELHVKEKEKRGSRIEIANSDYILADFDYFKSEICADLKKVKCTDLEDSFIEWNQPMTKL